MEKPISAFENRQRFYKQLEKERNSKVLLYATSHRPGMEGQIERDVIDVFVDHLDAMRPTDKISLILHTHGGDTAAAWQLINLLRIFGA